MNALIARYRAFEHWACGWLSHLDGIPPLLFRLYLVPIFWMAGITKWQHFDSTVSWFGNPDWGLGLPMPTVLAFLATWAEILGAVLLLLGLAVRWIALPLMVTMIVAMATVHWQHGWSAIAETNPDSLFATERSIAAGERLERAKSILKEHGNYDWLTEKGKFVVLNNGIEFAATYFLMLLSLFFTGGGRYVSLDDGLRRLLSRRSAP